MKTISSILVVILIMTISNRCYSQGINFQGVARSANGTILASQKIGLKLSIISGNNPGTVEYIETRIVTTNPQGIFSIAIGDTGTLSNIGSFININWKLSNKFLKVEMDPTAGSNFIFMGTTPLQYVPYAYYSYGVDALNVAGILPVKSGGTGVTSISDLKITLGIDKINNTADLDKPISILTELALATKLNKVDTLSLSNRVNALSKTVYANLRPDYLLDSIGNIAIGVNALSKTQYRKDSVGIGFIADSANLLPQNIAIGDSALLLNTSGAFNIAIGTRSLSKITNTGDNTALGFASLLNLTSLNNGGWSNTAIGTTTLMNNQNGISNVAIGSGSMENGNTGNFNSAVGVVSLFKNRGNFNSSFGMYSLYRNTSGIKNTAIGASAGFSNLTGNFNTFIGNETNTSSDSISNATAIGNGAIINTSNTIQLGNAAITDVKTNGAITAAGFKVPGGNSGQYLRADGTFATLTTSVVPYTGASQAVDLGAYDLKVNGITVGVGSKTITSTSNTAIGNLALSRNTEGKWNSANGFSTLKNNTTGYNNTANGAFSLMSNTIGNDNTAIGLHAGSSNMIGSMNTSIGSEALMQNYTGSNNTALGYQADVASANLSNATAIGSGAVVSTSNTIQLGNTAVTDVKTSGAITAAGFKVPGGTSAQYLKADGSVATSVTAGVPYSGASQAVDLGAYDLKVNGITIGVGSKTITSTNIIDNTAIGNGVLINNRTGLANTANGYNALQNNTSGSSNTAIGAFTLLYNTTGGNNTAIGIGAIYNNTSGSNNTATGLSASYRNTTGDNNTANGFEALQTNSTGSNNTALGYRADMASANLSNATAIGSGAVVSASNTIQLGNTSITSVVTSGTIKSNGMISNLVSKTSAYTVQTSDEIITGDATSASFTISLPTAVGITGQTFTIKRLNAGVNSVSIGTTSSQTIDGAPSWVLNAQYKFLKVVSNGANWLIIANN